MRWLSAAVLVAVNLIPLIGVASWGWSLMLILVLYWIESGIVGAINVGKLRGVRRGARASATGQGLAHDARLLDVVRGGIALGRA